MGKKYVSMQEQLAARKAAAGYESPQKANAREPEKEALSAKLKGALDKGSRKAAKQASNRGHKGVNWKKAVNASPDPDEGWRTGEPVEDHFEEYADDIDEAIDAELIEDDATELSWDEAAKSKLDDLFSDETEHDPKTLIVLAIGAFLMIVLFAIFSMDDGDEDVWDDIDYASEYDLTSESTDKEVMDVVDEVLYYHEENDQEELSQWIEDTDIGKLVGKKIISWHCDHGDKYIRLMTHFANDNVYEVEEVCREASDRLQEAVDESDLEEPPAVVVVARSKEDESLMLLLINGDLYFEGEYESEDVWDDESEEDSEEDWDEDEY